MYLIVQRHFGDAELLCQFALSDTRLSDRHFQFDGINHQKPSSLVFVGDL